MAGCDNCHQPAGLHLPNCIHSANRSRVKVNEKDMQADWYPKLPNGKPVPPAKLTREEQTYVAAKGDMSKVKIKDQQAYLKHHKENRRK